MDKEDKRYAELVNRFAKNEKKLINENKKLKEKIKLLKTFQTPEEFDKEYKKIVKGFISKLKRKTYWVNGHSTLCNEIDEIAEEQGFTSSSKVPEKRTGDENVKDICVNCGHHENFHFGAFTENDCVFGMRISDNGVIKKGCGCKEFDSVPEKRTGEKNV